MIHALLLKIKRLFCKHYYPGTATKYEWPLAHVIEYKITCIKCGHQQTTIIKCK